MSGIERMSVSVCSRVPSNTQAQSTLLEEAPVLPSITGESLETCPIAPPCTQVCAVQLDGEGQGLC